jgi:AraC-like DNA-binding protein
VFVVSPLLEAALVALSAEPVSYDEHGRGGHLAALVLDEIRRAPRAAFALPVPRDPRLAKLARALIEDPGSSLNIDSWADAIAVSRRTMTRLFREQTGMSFGAWRRRLRLLRAAARQADGEPISRVAASLGYRSVAAFQAMARREFGAGLRLPRQQEESTGRNHMSGGDHGSASRQLPSSQPVPLFRTGRWSASRYAPATPRQLSAPEGASGRPCCLTHASASHCDTGAMTFHMRRVGACRGDAASVP